MNEYMSRLEHPMKEEMEAVRAIILKASGKIAERVKWNAPSFYFREDLAAFNPRKTEFVHLIVLFPEGTTIPDGNGVVEANHKNRREAKFYDMADIQAKTPALTKMVRDWVREMEA